MIIMLTNNALRKRFIFKINDRGNKWDEFTPLIIECIYPQFSKEKNLNIGSLTNNEWNTIFVEPSQMHFFL